jgi:hypothetical protein
VFRARYELGFYVAEDDILHSHRRENLKAYKDFIKQRRMFSAPIINSVTKKFLCYFIGHFTDTLTAFGLKRLQLY